MIKLPTIEGIIDRRILINYTLDPEVAAKLLPAPFRPQMYKGRAIVGICLIRLKNIRLKGLPAWTGIASENAAHRFAVEWDEYGTTKQGVYIPRRDTSSRINSWAGGRVFPGKHYHAEFDVNEQGGNYNIGFTSSDKTHLQIKAKETEALSTISVFESLDCVSSFFQNGSLGYSPHNSRFDGIRLHTHSWEVCPLEVVDVNSSYFNHKNLFPEGSVQFDNALLMKNIRHEWRNENYIFYSHNYQ